MCVLKYPAVAVASGSSCKRAAGVAGRAIEWLICAGFRRGAGDATWFAAALAPANGVDDGGVVIGRSGSAASVTRMCSHATDPRQPPAWLGRLVHVLAGPTAEMNHLAWSGCPTH